MKRSFLYVIVVLLIFMFAGCGGSGNDTTVTDRSVVVKTSGVAPGDECSNGGIAIDTGIDENGNGILDSSEVDNTQIVCNGTDGSDGLLSLISISDEPSGDNCTDGGVKIEAGLDENNNAILDSEEVDETRYVCDGTDGTNGSDGGSGSDGLSTLISVSQEPEGDNCTNGGIKIEAGLDDNSDGILSTEEVDDTAFVCNGVDGTDSLSSLISVSDEPPGANCTNGGIKIDTGLDDNLDGVLDTAEVDSTTYLCTGTGTGDGTNGLNSLVSVSSEPSGANCTNGGIRIDTGLDDNRDGVLAPDEVDDTAYVCNGVDGADGLKSLVSVSSESPGANCENGGIKIDTGLDDDLDGILDPDEVDDTAYVCNGTGDGSAVFTYTVGGTVSGLSGALTLQLNGGEELDITADGSFAFATRLSSGVSYSVTVAIQPSSQTCTVINGSGTIPGADVTGILVFCSADTYAVGGTVSGLTGTLTLQNNGGDDLVVTGDGAFTFATAIADGASYNVTVLTHPDGQTCSVTKGTGSISGADVTDVTVACLPDSTVPAVVSTYPVSSAVDVALDVTIIATFSEKMDPSTITASTFKLYDDTASASVTGTVTYDVTSKAALFDPVDDLVIGHAYTAKTTTGVTDLAHNALAAVYSWSFAVVDPPVNTTSVKKISGCEFINIGAVATTSDSVTLSISATDDVGVAAYYITDNGTGIIPAAPDPDASGWSAVTPTTDYNADIAYTFANTYSDGDRVFVYAWFKDESGNVSGVASDAIRKIAAEKYVFFDDFEDGIGLWWASNGIWEVGVPTSGPGEAHSNSTLAGTVLDGNYPDNVNSALVSPSIELPAIATGEEIHLRFWQWFSIGGYDNASIQVSEETAPGVWSGWTTLTTYSGNSGGVWSYPFVDLSAYAGEKVRIGFALKQGNSGPYFYKTYVGPGWFFDDVSITVGQTIVLDSGDTYLYDFTGCLDGWWASNGMWQAGSPTAGPSEAYSGSNLTGTVLDGNYPDNVNGALVSPSIELPAIATGEEIHLRFWQWFSIGAYDNASIQVSKETAPGVWSGWTILTTYSGNSGDVWSYPLVDLSAYAGEKVRIGFALKQGNSGPYFYKTYVGPGWFFDDVSITFYTP
ncbi:MAG: Ig-like domain-containing protein [Nitrospirota bacterium]|nr:Ig-like domain-containing protein [Nitrospirota bacterium]